MHEQDLIMSLLDHQRILFMHFSSRDDDNPRRGNYFRSTTWTGQTFTTHTTMNTQQNQLAIKVSADN